MDEQPINRHLHPKGAGKSIFSWCLYDWANSAFSTIIITFIFSVYFGRGMIGDETAGSVQWGYAIGISGLFIAFLGPICGAIADHSGARKKWAFWFSMLCVLGSALLWFGQPLASPNNILFILGCVVVANIGYELSLVFYNSMLPHIAPKHLWGRISGWGWGIGYIGGLAALVFALYGLMGVGEIEPFLPISGADSMNVRATGPLVALWFLLFMIPFMVYTHDVERSPMSVKDSVRAGLAQLVTSLREVKKHKNLAQFLVASAVYRDGLNTLFAMGGIYAAGIYGMDLVEILHFAIGMNVTAGLGAFAFSYLDDKVGSKPTVILSLLGLIVAGVAVLFAPDKDAFMMLALVLGIFVGPAQAASRTLAGRLAPHGMVTQTYGLYAFTGKSVAFLGPIAYGATTHYYGTQSAGMFTIIMFWIIGLGLMNWVTERRDD